MIWALFAHSGLGLKNPSRQTALRGLGRFSSRDETTLLGETANGHHPTSGKNDGGQAGAPRFFDGPVRTRAKGAYLGPGPAFILVGEPDASSIAAFAIIYAMAALTVLRTRKTVHPLG